MMMIHDDDDNGDLKGACSIQNATCTFISIKLCKTVQLYFVFFLIVRMPPAPACNAYSLQMHVEIKN
jgi:hypothetical protein